MRKVVFCLLIILIICSSVNISSAHASETNYAENKHLSISTVDNRPLYIDRLIFAALNDIDYHVEITSTASLQQGYNLANSGERDGVVSSTPNMEATYPHLIKVPVILENNNVLVFTKEDAPFDIDGWSSLSGRSVGILTERVYIKNNIPFEADVFFRESTKTLFEGLSNGDYSAVVITIRGHETLNLPEGIISAGEIESLQEYLYLNKRHEELVPLIAGSLTKVLEDGRGDIILNDIQAPEIYTRSMVLHIVSENREIQREAVFQEKLKEATGDADIEWYTFDLNFRFFLEYPNRFSYFSGLLRQDCVSRNVAAIVISGEDAYEFTKAHYNLFFRNVPVIYIGISPEQAAEIGEIMPDSTGIIENPSAYETVAEAIKLFPATENVFVLNDYSREGVHYRSVVEEELKQFSYLNIIYNENEDFSLVLNQIEELPSNTIILAGSYFIDASWKYYSLSEIEKMLKEHSDAPIFTFYSPYLPYGAIGGKCLDYRKYGEIAGTTLRRILEGESPSDIPAIYDSAHLNEWIFNKRLLDKWKINESSLPAGSEIMNKNPSVWETNPAFAYSISALFLLGAAVIIGLTIFLGKYRKQNKDLLEMRKTLHTAEELIVRDAKIRDAKERLEHMINAAPDVAYLVSADGTVVEANDYLRGTTGIEPGQTAMDLFADPVQGADVIERLNKNGQLTNEILWVKLQCGKRSRYLANMSVTEYEDRRAIVLWAVDIERAESQKDELSAMQQRLSEINERTARIINSAPIAYSMSIDGILIEANESMKRYTSIEIGDHMSSAYAYPEDHKEVAERIYENGLVNNHLIKLKFNEGDIHRCVLNAALVDYDGKTAIVSWMIDFEQDELRKDRLKDERRSLQAILDSMPLPIVIADTQSQKLVYVNSDYLKLVGLETDERPAGVNEADATGESGKKGLTGAELLPMLCRSPELISQEIQLRTYYGDIVDMRILTKPIEYLGEKAVMAIMTDLSAEKEYKRAGQNLQKILDHLPIPVRIIDKKELSVIYANNSCADLFKISSAEEMFGKPIMELMPEFQEGGVSSQEFLRSAVDGSVCAETKYICADGSLLDTRIQTCGIDYMGSEASLSIISDLAAELEQRRMRQSLQTVLDALPIPVRILDTKTSTIIYVNKSLLEMFEYESAEELLGQHISKIIPVLQTDGTPTLNKLVQIYASEEGTPIELEYITRSGKKIDSILIACMVDFQGEKASLGIIKDLAVEKEQEQMRICLQTIMDTMPVPLCIMDCETRKIVYGNDAYLNMLTISSPDVIGELDAVDTVARIQDDGKSASELIELLVSSTGTMITEIQSVEIAGKSLDVRLLTRPIVYMGESSVMGILTDLSKEKQYKTMQQNLQTAMDILPTPIWIVNIDDMTYLYANKSALDLFGVEAAEALLGQSSTKYMPMYQPDGKSSAERSAAFCRSIEMTSDEFVFIKENGTSFDALITSLLIDYNGKLCSLATIHDLTAEKEYEAMLVNAAEKEKEANQLKSRFLVNMSHEIRTPMNAIIGLSEIELRRELKNETKEVYKKINDSAKSLLAIINDILDLSKIEADKMELLSEEFDLEEVLYNALLVATMRIEDKHIEFMLDADADLPRYLMGDKSRLWQILKNFLDNSAKYTTEGRIILTARVEKELSDAKTATITFTVEDTGIGMTAEQLNLVFMPYEQFYSEAQKRYSGTGLGMSIAKQLCELMGGHLNITSKRGIGTKITFVIPFELSARTGKVLLPSDTSLLTGKRVLIVDDDSMALDIMTRLLKANGANCVTAFSGLEAMKTVFGSRDEGEFFDAILLDYMMEGLNGIETAKQIQMSLSQVPKLLMVTSCQKANIKDELAQSDICDVIEKPFVPTQFIKKLSKALGIDAVAEEKQKTFTLFNNVNALVCEDNILNQEVAVGMLKFFGIVPVVSDNGRRALEVLKKNQSFDIIFMDLQMPVMDGYEAAQEIRKDGRFDNVPIISLTADAMPEVVDRCLKIGMNDHLAKPIDFDSLYKMLITYLPAEKRDLSATMENPRAAGRKSDLLSRFQGDFKLYEKALDGFAKGLPDEWPSLEDMIGSLDETLISLHNIKGAAGNLSEEDLYSSTMKLEEALRKGKCSDDLYNRFIVSSAATKAKARKKPDCLPEEEGTTDEVLLLFDRLENALKDYDPIECGETVDLLKKKKWPGFDETMLFQMYEQAAGYEFDEALSQLIELKRLPMGE